ncbi:MAG TPA: VOC family protein [Thermomicrobiales bacterium]|nr:VOC family protein [Thermomicrobiales bacterium]
MAYRFLLEVPEDRIDEANVVVGGVRDAQVVLVRNPHGMGFADPYADVTVACHTLAVIEAIYDWYESAGVAKPALAIVLHSGERVALAGNDRREMIRRIRRDQPWVEHTLPKIGDHMRDIVPGQPPAASALAAVPGFDVPALQPVLSPTRQLTIHGQREVAVDVPDLDRAERYYVDFLGMTVFGRERRDAKGFMHLVEDDYNHTRALSEGTEADVSYLGNGGVSMALIRVGRGARLTRSAEPPIALTVAHETFLEIKGHALIRGVEIDGDGERQLAARDIYGLVWTFAVGDAQEVGQRSA